MEIYTRIFDLLIAHIAWISMTTALPLVRTLTEHPSTHRRVKMAHKFGMVAINSDGKVYLTTDLHDPNTMMIIFAYGLQKHRIQGEKSGLSIAMDVKGRVTAKKEITNESLFEHRILANYRHVFESANYKGYFLGFNKQRLPKKGNKARIWKNDRCYFHIFRPNALEVSTRNTIFSTFYKDSWKRNP